MVIVSYLPAMLWGGFVWDDEILTSSQAVQEGWSGLWRLWSGDAYNYYDTKEGHYWPLVYTTFWLENKLWGFAPRGYHIVNVLLHLANTLLLWHLLRRLAVPGTWMVAAVFAVHPLHVESVAWV
ncbi:MAG: O-GlcNAc transferase, partial [Gemmatimonadetes bacterium]|nr:O-GlcNAc transferase [Gemmatimonadota bacterium]